MSGLDSTFDLLRSERSKHAEAVWLAALRSERRFVRDAAFRASLMGAPLPVQLEVLRRWKTYDDPTRRALAESISKFQTGLRAALASNESDDRATAIAIALALRLHSLVSDLIHLAEEADEATRESAARVVLRLAQSLKADHVDESQAAVDPQCRARVFGSLEQAIKRFNGHRRTEVVEAFLLLADSENATLHAVLDAPSNVNFVAIFKELQRVQFEILPDDLIVEMLDQQGAPDVIKRLWSERVSERFVRAMLVALGKQPSPICLFNIKKLNRFDWLDEATASISRYTLDEQQGLLTVATNSGIHSEDRSHLLCELTSHAELPVRVAAIRALAPFRTDDVNHFVLELAQSGPTCVKAEALRQLKERNLPGAMSRLRVALDSAEEDVRKVGAEAFADYTMDWYLSGFELMDEEARQPNGEIVLRVDSEATERLRKELGAVGKRTRMRAIQVASTLNLLDQVQDLVASMLMDEDQFVRLEAVNALATCGTPEAQQSLNLALADESRNVRDAAAGALQRLVESRARVRS